MSQSTIELPIPPEIYERVEQIAKESNRTTIANIARLKQLS